MLQACATCKFMGRSTRPDDKTVRACRFSPNGSPLDVAVGRWRSDYFGVDKAAPDLAGPCPGWQGLDQGSYRVCNARGLLFSRSRCVEPAGHAGRCASTTETWVRIDATRARFCVLSTCFDRREMLMPGEHCECGRTEGPPFGYESAAGIDVIVTDLRRAVRLEQQFFVELRFQGGGSDKFYRGTHLPAGSTEIRWGRWNTAGQAQFTPPAEMINRLSEKMEKGYLRVYPDRPWWWSPLQDTPRASLPGTGSAPAGSPRGSVPDARAALVQQLLDATQRPVTPAQLAEMAMVEGWTNHGNADPELVALFQGAESAKLYRHPEGSTIVVVRYPDGVRTFGKLKAGSRRKAG